MQQTRLQNLSPYHSLRLPKLSTATLQKLCVADLTCQNVLLQPRCTSKNCLLKKKLSSNETLTAHCVGF